jgi:hypothetical protein
MKDNRALAGAQSLRADDPGRQKDLNFSLETVY